MNFHKLNARRLSNLGIYVILADQERDGRLVRAGSVIITHQRNRAVLYSDLFAALRGRQEILGRYRDPANGEIVDLERKRERLAEAGVALAEGEDILTTAALATVATDFARVRNTEKAEARDKAQAGVVRTRYNKTNRGATAARVTAVRDRLVRRGDQARQIAVWIRAQRDALEDEIRVEMNLVLEIFRAATSWQDQLKKASWSLSAAGQKGLAVRFGNFLRDLSRLEAQPFRGATVKLRQGLSAFVAATKAGDRAAMIGALDQVIATTLLVMTFGAVSNTIGALLIARNPTGDNVVGQVNDLISRLEAWGQPRHRPFPLIDLLGVTSRLRSFDGEAAARTALADLRVILGGLDCFLP